MLIKQWIGLPLAALLLVLASPGRAEQTFRVVSFMINELGRDAEAEYERSLLGLANIIREMNVDALALQGGCATRKPVAPRRNVSWRCLISRLNRKTTSHTRLPLAPQASRKSPPSCCVSPSSL